VSRSVRSAGFGGAILISLGLLVGVGFLRTHGWDQQLICDGNRLLMATGNPYSMSELSALTGQNLSIPYLPIWLPLLAIPCGLDTWIIQGSILLMGLWMSLLILRQESTSTSTPWMSVAALIVGGFGGVAWNFRSGNFGLLEWVGLLAVVWIWSRTNRAGISGFLLGIFSSLKLLPALYSVLPLFVVYLIEDRKTPHFLEARRSAFRFFLGAMVGLAVMISLSALIFPAAFSNYMASFQADSVPKGAHLAWRETLPDHNSPTPFLGVMYFVEGLLGVSGGIGRILAWVGIVCVGALMTWGALRKTRLSIKQKGLIAAFVLFFLMPRIKPYAFVALLIPAVGLLPSARMSLRRELLFWGLTLGVP